MSTLHHILFITLCNRIKTDTRVLVKDYLNKVRRLLQSYDEHEEPDHYFGILPSMPMQLRVAVDEIYVESFGDIVVQFKSEADQISKEARWKENLEAFEELLPEGVRIGGDSEKFCNMLLGDELYSMLVEALSKRKREQVVCDRWWKHRKLQNDRSVTQWLSKEYLEISQDDPKETPWNKQQAEELRRVKAS